MSELKRHHINEVMDMHALTRGELCYSQVYYADDVDGVFAKLKARIHELENMPHTDNSAVIELLENENAQLKESRQAWIARAGVAEENLAKLEKELAELREATRWRDVEKEPPEIKEDSEEVAVLVEYENNYSRGVFVTYSDFYKGVFYETHLDKEINCDYDNDGERCYQKVIKWQPMPKAPEADK